MAIRKEKKEEIITKLKDIAKDSESIVFLSFNALTANEANDMREAFVNEGVGYFVAKKTLIKIAFSDTKIKGELPNLNGEIAIAYGDDPIAPARAIREADKKIEGELKIIGGVFKGEFQGAEKMQELSAIPRLDVLYTNLLIVIKAPIRGFVSSLNQIAEKSA